MGRWGIINALLGVFVALLLFEITRIWTRTLPPIEVVQRPTGSAPAPKGEAGKGKRGDKGGNTKAVEQSPPALVTAIADRDLFDPSRAKPSEQAAAPVAPVVQPPQNVQINGVRVFGKDREAFVMDSGQSRRVRVGDQIQGYTVKMIKPTELVMASPSGDPVSMTLAVEKGKAPAGPPGAAKPPGAPPRPGQPAGPAAPAGNASPAAGVTAASSPAAGIQPPKPAAPGPQKPGQPGMPNVVPPAPGMPPPVVQPGVPATAAAAANPNAQVPNQVRDSLERFREQQRERREGRNK